MEFKAFTNSARAICLAWFVVYGIHYWAVDIPAKKDHLELWAWQRFITSTANFLGVLVTFTPWYKRSSFYKLPLILVTAVMLNQQAFAMTLRADVPFFYVPLQACLAIALLRLSPLVSIALLPVLLLFARVAFFARPGQNHHIVSASIVTAMLLAVVRSRMFVDLRAFIAEQENLEAQKSLISAQQALVDQLQGFLPREIYKRVQRVIGERNWSPLRAVDEILRPKDILAAVTYSDIRGFTRLTNSKSSKFRNLVRAAQQIGTEIVERFRGIPRLQGDLIFSYFDLESPALSMTAAIRSSFEMLEETRRLNSGAESADRIQRYLVLTFGSVTVGNIGSTEGARDITVIGSAANLSSRIDNITKEPSLKAVFESHPVLLSEEAFKFALSLFPTLQYSELVLADFQVSLRDFPEESRIYCVPTNDSNWMTLGKGPDTLAGETYINMTYSNAASHTNEDLAA